MNDISLLDHPGGRPAVPAPLDPGFVPASLWNRAYQRLADKRGGDPLTIAVERSPSSVSVFSTRILADEGEFAALNGRYVERIVKFLLWQKGGHRVIVSGNERLASLIRETYSPGGARAFDHQFMGERIYGKPFTVEAADPAPAAREPDAPLGRHMDGCRIGFDLGGSDRKCAALIDGRLVFSEEVPWDPYFQADPQYHFDGVDDTLRRAAAHLPRVDAIGGSAAGVYIDSEPRVASLFRGVSPERFDAGIRPLFRRLRERWGGVPFLVVNDGEVAALAASMALGENAVLGVSLGTSQAAGYVTPGGAITDWLNELAFAPVDYRRNGPRDEWSGDEGVGAQYFSQQAVSRLLPAAGIEVPDGMPLAERLVQVQRLLADGDVRARRIYETLGVYLGYALAHYAGFYTLRHVQVMGRVTSGDGGAIIVEWADSVLRTDFPEIAAHLHLHLPSEQEKRHGQAAAAATLPPLSR